MNGCTMLMCKFGECSYIIRFHHDRSFADLISELKMTCGFGDDVSIHVFYSIPGHSKCMLRNDRELEFMIEFAIDLNMKCVNLIIEVEDSSQITSNNVLTGEGDRVVSGLVRGDVRTTSGLDDITLSSHASSSKSVVCSNSVLSSRVGNLMSSNWSTLITHVGQVFEGGVVHFRDDLCKFSLELGFPFNYERNNSKRVHVVCKNKDKDDNQCTWSIIACVPPSSRHCCVKTFVNEHSCCTVFDVSGAKRLTAVRIASEIREQIIAKPVMVAKEVNNHLHINYGFQVPYKRAWRALEKRKDEILGDHVKSFSLLQGHLSNLLATNPGSHVALEVDDDSRRFRRVFIAFAASIHGFNFVRPLLFLDGTFLKGRSKGVLLAAVGKDGDQGLYPLAFAVVDLETEDNWRWFLIELRKVIASARVVNFVSDRNAGLLEALPEVFPSCHHFFCIRHLQGNLRDRFVGRTYSASLKDDVVSLFGQCADAPTKPLFREKLVELKLKGGEIVEKFLDDLPLHYWTNVYSMGCRYGEMISNAVESFNNWIVGMKVPFQ